METTSQLQAQVNTIAGLAHNTFGTLQRDVTTVRLSPDSSEPPDNPSMEADTLVQQPKIMSTTLVKAAKQVINRTDFPLQFDLLVAALPLSEGGPEAQLKRIAELQAENEAVGLELKRQLEAAEQELQQVQELFNQAADNCLHTKKAHQ